VWHGKERMAYLAALVDLVWNALVPFIVSGLVLPTGPPPGDAHDRAPNHVSFCVRGVKSAPLLERLEREGVVASAGSACHSDSGLPSHVLVTRLPPQCYFDVGMGGGGDGLIASLGVPLCFIHGSVRLTLSHTNTRAEMVSVVVDGVWLIRNVHCTHTHKKKPNAGNTGVGTYSEGHRVCHGGPRWLTTQRRTVLFIFCSSQMCKRATRRGEPLKKALDKLTCTQNTVHNPHIIHPSFSSP
jgi:hypothetical protein